MNEKRRAFERAIKEQFMTLPADERRQVIDFLEEMAARYAERARIDKTAAELLADVDVSL